MNNVRIVTVAAASLFTTVVASAQSFNINFGTTATPTISNSYGAAAGQAGTWNLVTNPAVVNQPLMTTTGAATAATLSLDGGSMFFFPTSTPNGTTTSGDAEALLDSLWDPGIGNPAGNITISNLAAGIYNIYTYAVAPDSATATTSVNVNGLGAQNVGGQLPNPFNNQFAVGLTHALHQNVVIAGGASIQVGVVTTFASINGIQIVLVPGPGGLAMFGLAGLIGARRRCR